MGSRSPSSPVATALAYGIQVTLAALVLVSPGTSSPGGWWNYGLGILLLPAALRWVCRRPLSPFQRVWVSVPLAVHALGAIYGFYGIGWYDHLAHLLSASLVVGGGYAVGIALLRVSSGDRPRWVLHAATLLLIVVGGVAWEAYEMVVPHLTVYGAEDVILDVVFDVVGWAVLVPTHRRLLGRLPRDFTARAVAYAGHTRPLPE